MNGNTDRPSVAVAGIALPTYVTPEILDGVFFPDDLKKLISGIVVNGIERPHSIHPDLQKAFTSQ